MKNSCRFFLFFMALFAFDMCQAGSFSVFKNGDEQYKGKMEFNDEDGVVSFPGNEGLRIKVINDAGDDDDDEKKIKKYRTIDAAGYEIGEGECCCLLADDSSNVALFYAEGFGEGKQLVAPVSGDKVGLLDVCDIRMEMLLDSKWAPASTPEDADRIIIDGKINGVGTKMLHQIDIAVKNLGYDFSVSIIKPKPENVSDIQQENECFEFHRNKEDKYKDSDGEEEQGQEPDESDEDSEESHNNEEEDSSDEDSDDNARNTGDDSDGNDSHTDAEASHVDNESYRTSEDEDTIEVDEDEVVTLNTVGSRSQEGPSVFSDFSEKTQKEPAPKKMKFHHEDVSNPEDTSKVDEGTVAAQNIVGSMSQGENSDFSDVFKNDQKEPASKKMGFYQEGKWRDDNDGGNSDDE